VTQNIYDDPEFFEGYSQLPRSIVGLDGAPEWASLRALLPDIRGRRVVDLGCGYGWFCRWAAEQGAESVLGIDVSVMMLAKAAAMTTDTAITYTHGDLEHLELPQASFDLAYSSLAFHYLEHLPKLLATVYNALVPGGSLIFSVEHPLLTAPSQPAWTRDAEGRKRWPIDSYLLEGPRITNWISEGVVKQHRTLSTYINLLLNAGFNISHVDEWGPTDAQIAKQPNLAEERQRPTFLLIAANR